MKIGRNSLEVRILVPILLLVAVVSFSLLLLVYRISDHIIQDYHDHASAAAASEVQRIIDAGFAELTAARLLGNPVVAEAKKRSIIEAITLYWSQNHLRGVIADGDGQFLVSALDPELTRRVLSTRRTGPFWFDDAGEHIHGFVTEFPAWNWRITTIISAASPLTARKELAWLLPLVGLGFLLTAGGTVLVLRRTVQRPVASLLRDITAAGNIEPTGIAEFDTIGSAMNAAFAQERQRAGQFELLHGLAISIQELLPVEAVLNTILERSASLVGAQTSTIVLYGDAGEVQKALTYGDREDQELLRGEQEVLETLKRSSTTPLLLPGSGGRNYLGHPIASSGGSHIGALCFSGKAGGFTRNDTVLIQAIAADAAIAITKSQQVRQLALFKEMADASFDIIMITGSDGFMQYVNPAFTAITGYTPGEVLGLSPDMLQSDEQDAAFHRNVWDTLHRGQPWKGELVNRKKDGEHYIVSAVLFPVHSDEGLHYVSVQRDITQEKRLHEQLLRAQKMEAIGTLAGGIAHDFNNVLTGILGYADIIQRRAAGDEQLAKFASVIKQAAERGADLAKKILMVSRKEKLVTRPVDLNETIRSTAELFQRSMPKDIELVLNLAENLPPVKADPSQMQQVIMNLAVNARDAMPEGGRLAIETSVVGADRPVAAELPASELVRLSFSDTGLGMDRNTQQRIFDPFFTTKEAGKGTGLGLYIVHSVVHNHGGYISLYSEPGKGTRFSIYLPASREVWPANTAEPLDIRGTGTILVIDDEQHVRELCRDMLEPLGYRVLTAATGEDGVRALRENRDTVSAVILDMIMPKMGGSEIFSALKAVRPDIKVLLCSGYSTNGFAGIDRLLAAGAGGFLQKPFTVEALGTAIQRVLAGSRPSPPA